MAFLPGLAEAKVAVNHFGHFVQKVLDAGPELRIGLTDLLQVEELCLNGCPRSFLLLR